jgi:hypothetical protein
MIQSLHIFRKDVRHVRLDLCLYAITLIAAAVAIPRAWNAGYLADTPFRIFVALLTYAIPILWLVLIARVIHDEAIVSDTQFWMTRPYRWTSLLSAKVLFIVFCLVLPFGIMQLAMVVQAGAEPFPTIPAQLLSLLQTALIVWLTFTVVASVTSNVQRMFMSMLAVILFWAGALTLVSASPGPRMALPFASQAFGIYLGVLVTSILIFQYASRHTFASRVALLVTALVFVELFACLVEGQIQGPVDLYVRHHYPLSTDDSLHLAFDPTSIPSQDVGQGQHSISKLVIARLPVGILGLAPDAQLNDQNVSFTIDAPGYHYTAPWRPADFQEDDLRLFLPQSAMDAARGANVHLHLSAVAQRLNPGTPQTVIAAESFRIPGNGTCHLLPVLSGDNVLCRYPYEIRWRTSIRTSVVSGNCIKPGAVQPAMETLAARSPANGPDPTLAIPLHLGGSVCPGTPLIFTDYHPAKNFRLELDLPSLSLERYLVR